VKRHFPVVTLASAASLALFGVLLTLNRLVWVTTQLEEALDAVGPGRLVNLG
jgi:hypothetical protein